MAQILTCLIQLGENYGILGYLRLFEKLLHPVGVFWCSWALHMELHVEVCWLGVNLSISYSSFLFLFFQI